MVIKKNRKPVAHCSQKLSPSQMNCTTTEKQLLSVVEMLHTFHSMSLGARSRSTWIMKISLKTLWVHHATHCALESAPRWVWTHFHAWKRKQKLHHRCFELCANWRWKCDASNAGDALRQGWWPRDGMSMGLCPSLLNKIVTHSHLLTTMFWFSHSSILMNFCFKHLVLMNLIATLQVTNIALFSRMQCCLDLSHGVTISLLTQKVWCGWKPWFDAISGMAAHVVKFGIIWAHVMSVPRWRRTPPRKDNSCLMMSQAFHGLKPKWISSVLGNWRVKAFLLNFEPRQLLTLSPIS